MQTAEAFLPDWRGLARYRQPSWKTACKYQQKGNYSIGAIPFRIWWTDSFSRTVLDLKKSFICYWLENCRKQTSWKPFTNCWQIIRTCRHILKAVSSCGCRAITSWTAWKSVCWHCIPPTQNRMTSAFRMLCGSVWNWLPVSHRWQCITTRWHSTSTRAAAWYCGNQSRIKPLQKTCWPWCGQTANIRSWKHGCWIWHWCFMQNTAAETILLLPCMW